MRAVIVALALVIGAPPAAGAELSATMQRAAYCQGVLKYTLENHEPGDTPANVCSGWQKQGYPSREACHAAGEQEALAGIRAKLARYADYFRLEMSRSILLHSQDGTDAMTSAAFIQGKGRRDAHKMRTAPVSAHKLQCAQRCGTDFRCLVDCVATQLPTDASVMRCGLLPDELPY
jgi:hypothetical protein